MSQGSPIPADVARRAADRVAGLLELECERIELAGSLRRGKAAVHDVELVAVPRFGPLPTGDIWGSTEPTDLLEIRIAGLLGEAEASGLTLRWVEVHRSGGPVELQTRNGRAYKALSYAGVPVDLFIVRPPATWGVLFALRTGPGRWNTELVTRCQDVSRRVREGRVEAWQGATGRWEPLDTPEERDFFRAIGQPWVEPADRDVDRVAITRAIAEGIKP